MDGGARIGWREGQRPRVAMRIWVIGGQWREVMMLLKIQREGVQRERARERECKFVFCLLSWHSPHGLSSLMYEPPLYPHKNRGDTELTCTPHYRLTHAQLSQLKDTDVLWKCSDLAVRSSLHAIFFFKVGHVTWATYFAGTGTKFLSNPNYMQHSFCFLGTSSTCSTFHQSIAWMNEWINVWIK